MKPRSLRIPVALAWTALSSGGLCVVLSCGAGTEPVPTCPGACIDSALDQVVTEAGPTPDGPSAPDSPNPTDGPVPDFVV